MGARHRKPLPEPREAVIESLSHDGRGVTHVEGKAVFVQGALAGERVRFAYTRLQRRYDEGRVEQIFEASPDRVQPRCAHFGVCGGCSLQHLAPRAQVAAKQRAMLDALERIGGVIPEEILPPLTGDTLWGYRRKARLGVKLVEKKGKVLVGFRERGSSFVTDVARCEVLHPRVGGIVGQLGELVADLSVRDRIPQIEVAVGDEHAVLVLRLLAPLSQSDTARLAAFGEDHDLEIYLQQGGPETVSPLDGRGVRLSYRLPSFDVRLHFLPLDFTQVNLDLNHVMVDRAIELLAPAPEDRVLDLFCGLGNFTLPLARRAGEVVGVEGDPGLVARARENATANGLGNVAFFSANLYQPLENEPWLRQRFDKLLLDPPRSGAAEVLPYIPMLGPERLVYISCYPGTLARDLGTLVRDLGFRLTAAGVMDMFPHTGHIESIAVLERA